MMHLGPSRLLYEKVAGGEPHWYQGFSGWEYILRAEAQYGQRRYRRHRDEDLSHEKCRELYEKDFSNDKILKKNLIVNIAAGGNKEFPFMEQQERMRIYKHA